MKSDKREKTVDDGKMLAPMRVENAIMTTQVLRRVIDRIANAPTRFEATDLIAAIPNVTGGVHFQQEVLNRLMQRWRRMGLVVFEKKRWTLTRGAWDRMQAEWSRTRDE